MEFNQKLYLWVLTIISIVLSVVFGELKITPNVNGDDEAFIFYNKSDTASWRAQTDAIDAFLSKYQPKNINHKNAMQCSGGHNAAVPLSGKFCWVSLEGLGPCSAASNYHYNLGQPCVFLSIENINWTPEPFTSVTQMPTSMPESALQRYKHDELYFRDRVLVTCTGTNNFDVENIAAITYFPEPAFLASHLSARKVDGYLPPFIAIQFERNTNFVVTSVTCKLWSRDIDHERNEWASVTFDMLIDA